MVESPHNTLGPLLHTTGPLTKLKRGPWDLTYILIVKKYPQAPLKNSARGVGRGQKKCENKLIAREAQKKIKEINRMRAKHAKN